ncbi:hypothetical protein [Oceanospirillum maris]|uniref:hypothetical protein n=1 Tax=Oceanospirillum maris TaxID=64977 RepID=UPI0004217CDC|nr:hypothetical protein [Oceanospirillum maris]
MKNPRDTQSAPIQTREIGDFDLERMKKAISGEKIKIPQGLTREQKKQFILSHA